MSHDPEMHKRAYLEFRKGLRFQEIAKALEIPQGVIHRWSTEAPECDCCWHSWNKLNSVDNDENHRKAFALKSLGHSVDAISESLGIAVNIVESWGNKDYPCNCGMHSWGSIQLPSRETLDIVPSDPPPLPSVLPSPIAHSLELSLHVTLDSLSKNVNSGDVAPRSWKDVLETLKTVHQILKEERGKTISPSTPLTFSEKTERSVSLPAASLANLEKKQSDLASELLSIVDPSNNSKESS